MRLYHFCAARHLDSILESGLILGRTPIQETDPKDPEYFFLKGFVNETQWLTLDPNWNAQSWCTSESIAYARNDYRLTIKLTLWESRNLLSVPTFCRINGLEEKLFKGWPGSENWRVYCGTIPPKRIVLVEGNPSLIPPTEPVADQPPATTDCTST